MPHAGTPPGPSIALDQEGPAPWPREERCPCQEVYDVRIMSDPVYYAGVWGVRVKPRAEIPTPGSFAHADEAEADSAVPQFDTPPKDPFRLCCW
jgi:hypothetical protein